MMSAALLKTVSIFHEYRISHKQMRRLKCRIKCSVYSARDSSVLSSSPVRPCRSCRLPLHISMRSRSLKDRSPIPQAAPLPSANWQRSRDLTMLGMNILVTRSHKPGATQSAVTSGMVQRTNGRGDGFDGQLRVGGEVSQQEPAGTSDSVRH